MAPRQDLPHFSPHNPDETQTLSGLTVTTMDFTTTPPRSLLIANGNDDEVLFLMWALKTAGIDRSADFVSSGPQAVTYLQDAITNLSVASQVQVLLLLDDQIPLMNALEVLAWIRLQPELKALSVYMLASSRLPGDLARAKRFGAREYWIKPANPGPRQFMDLALRLKAVMQPGAMTFPALEKSRQPSRTWDRAGVLA
jgi:CheY-like chemotaxis protein